MRFNNITTEIRKTFICNYRTSYLRDDRCFRPQKRSRKPWSRWDVVDQGRGLVQLKKRGKNLAVDLGLRKTGQEEIAQREKTPEDEYGPRAIVRKATAGPQAPTDGQGEGVLAQNLNTEAGNVHFSAACNSLLILVNFILEIV